MYISLALFTNKNVKITETILEKVLTKVINFISCFP